MIPATTVLHLLAPARFGGLEEVVRMLASNQREINAHVAVVLPAEEATDHPFCSALEDAKVPVTVIAAGARDYIGEYRRLSTLVAKLRPRVLHTHGYRSDVMGGLVARRFRVPTVSTVHGFTGGSRRNRLNERVQQLALRRADAVIAVSRPIVERLAAGGVASRRVYCVPNGFALAHASLDRAEARASLGLAAGQLHAAWMGRLSLEKNPELAVDALTLTRCDWRLSFIGDGPELGAARERADALGVQSRVRFHGRVQSAARFLPAFDAVVLSSRTEGTPIVLLEAMHAGIPIVACRVGGVPDMLGAREALLVPPGVPNGLAEALDAIARDPHAAHERVAAARARVREQFDAGRWTRAVRDVYELVMRRRA